MYYCIRFGFFILWFFIFPVYADSHHPERFLKKITGAKNEGEQIYNHYCMNCHATKPLIPLGAPRSGEEADWRLRLKQEVDLLFKHTDEGLNAMPPRGGCFECSDEQLILSIIQMVPKKDKKDLLIKLRAYKKST